MCCRLCHMQHPDTLLFMLCATPGVVTSMLHAVRQLFMLCATPGLITSMLHAVPQLGIDTPALIIQLGIDHAAFKWCCLRCRRCPGAVVCALHDTVCSRSCHEQHSGTALSILETGNKPSFSAFILCAFGWHAFVLCTDSNGFPTDSFLSRGRDTHTPSQRSVILFSHAVDKLAMFPARLHKHAQMCLHHIMLLLHVSNTLHRVTSTTKLRGCRCAHICSHVQIKPSHICLHVQIKSSHICLHVQIKPSRLCLHVQIKPSRLCLHVQIKLSHTLGGAQIRTGTLAQPHCYARRGVQGLTHLLPCSKDQMGRKFLKHIMQHEPGPPRGHAGTWTGHEMLQQVGGAFAVQGVLTRLHTAHARVCTRVHMCTHARACKCVCVCARTHAKSVRLHVWEQHHEYASISMWMCFCLCVHTCFSANTPAHHMCVHLLQMRALASKQAPTRAARIGSCVRTFAHLLHLKHLLQMRAHQAGPQVIPEQAIVPHAAQASLRLLQEQRTQLDAHSQGRLTWDARAGQ